MYIIRVFRSGVVLVGLGFFAVATLPGCDGGSGETGTQVKVNPNEQADRAKKIADRYKSQSPKSRGAAAGPGASPSAAPAAKK